MRSIDLLQSQIGDMLSHRLAQVRRESFILESLNEQHRDLNTPFENSLLFLKINLARAVPIDYLKISMDSIFKMWGSDIIRGPWTPLRANSVE